MHVLHFAGGDNRGSLHWSAVRQVSLGFSVGWVGGGVDPCSAVNCIKLQRIIDALSRVQSPVQLITPWWRAGVKWAWWSMRGSSIFPQRALASLCVSMSHITIVCIPCSRRDPLFLPVGGIDQPTDCICIKSHSHRSNGKHCFPVFFSITHAER